MAKKKILSRKILALGYFQKAKKICNSNLATNYKRYNKPESGRSKIVQQGLQFVETLHSKLNLNIKYITKDLESKLAPCVLISYEGVECFYQTKKNTGYYFPGGWEEVFMKVYRRVSDKSGVKEKNRINLDDEKQEIKTKDPDIIDEAELEKDPEQEYNDLQDFY